MADLEGSGSVELGLVSKMQYIKDDTDDAD